MTANMPARRTKDLDGAVIAHDFQGHGAVQDVDQLVAGMDSQ